MEETSGMCLKGDGLGKIVKVERGRRGNDRSIVHLKAYVVYQNQQLTSRG